MVTSLIAFGAGLLLGALGLLLALAARGPARFRVERARRIGAGAERLHPLIADLQAFNRWNPYARKAPDQRIRYRGPAAGPGAAFDFDGDRRAGRGSVEVIASQPPTAVTLLLAMSAPMACRNTLEFTLTPQGEATEVRWAMHGANSLAGRLVNLLIDCDAMIGRDFEAGLAELQRLAEQG